jgi:hypothetical protein
MEKVMRPVVISIAAIAAAMCVLGVIKASSRAASGAPVCSSTCNVAQHRVAMDGSMNMPQMGSASSDMTMGPHMKLSPTRTLRPGDAERANAVVATLRVTLSKYQDYRAAQADGYKQFLPNVKQPRYHFTSWVNSLAAEHGFDPTRPTSLLYDKVGDTYKLVGAMYTAPRSATSEQHRQVEIHRAERAIRAAWFDRHASGLRHCRRPFPACVIQLDGARVSVRIRYGQNLARGHAGRSQRLIPGSME